MNVTFTTANYSPNYEDSITIDQNSYIGLTPTITLDNYDIMSSGFGTNGIDIGGTEYYHSIYAIDKSNSTVVGNATYEGKDIYGAIIGSEVLLYTIEDDVATPIYYNEAVVSFGDWS